jgi:hypothetical protein
MEKLVLNGWNRFGLAVSSHDIRLTTGFVLKGAPSSGRQRLLLEWR